MNRMGRQKCGGDDWSLIGCKVHAISCVRLIGRSDIQDGSQISPSAESVCLMEISVYGRQHP